MEGLTQLTDFMRDRFDRLDGAVAAINGRVRANEVQVELLKKEHENANNLRGRVITALLTIAAGLSIAFLTTLFN